MVAPGIEPEPLDLQPQTLNFRAQRRSIGYVSEEIPGSLSIQGHNHVFEMTIAITMESAMC
jgi:hypothetical protein